jgi:hypothetical protein
MAEITQELMQEIFATIFDIDEAYIVPKQGNWFTPQAALELLEKPMTWLGYLITKDSPVSTPGYDVDVDVDDNPIQVLVTQCIVEIELNFIGTRAEECAKSVKNWVYRSDVEAQLARINGRMMNTDCVATPFNYIQEGMNTTLAWNVNFKIARKSIMPTGHLVIDETYNVEIGGTINE